MQVQAYFENINQVIAHELQQAEDTIYVAVAWFTDAILRDCLLQQSKKGVKVNLLYLDDDINKQYANFDTLRHSKNANVYAYPHSEGNNIMHHKFCVIDRQTVITGSYNWSKKAQSNEENITITKGNNTLALQFIQQFGKITELYCGANTQNQQNSLDINKLLKRLQLIKNFILLEEFDDLEHQLLKLQTYISIEEVQTLDTQLNAQLQQKAYAQAIELLDNFCNRYQQITLYNDPLIFALRLEIKALEMELTAISNEKADIEKQIHNFGIQHNQYLGKTIERILHLKQQLLERQQHQSEAKKEDYQEAKKDYEQYHQQYEANKNKVLHQLNEQDKNALKKSYRKAVMLCHPDKVSKAHQAQAQQIFTELETAYSENDLARVQEILSNLENKTPFVSRAEKYTQKAKLQAESQRIRQKKEILQRTISELKESPTYQTLQNINDWESYFKQSLKTLQTELNRLEQEVDN